MNAPSVPPTQGLVLGKFMPPHRGHQYLIDFARHFVDELTVVVASLPTEPIPGALRHGWVTEMFPNVNVVHLTDENPQYPEEHPDFWSIWLRSLLRVAPPPDFLFASEDYGARLAETLGAIFIPTGGGRELLPVSGTVIRSDPLAHWDFILECARPYFVRRVCVFGPESTGKTTLAQQLSEHYSTVAVPEFARSLLESKGGVLEPADIPHIARGQMAAEEALARQSNRLLVCDTDVLTTTLWSEVLFGDCPAWIRDVADCHRYDITLLTGVDVPWIADPVRYLPKERESFYARCVAELERLGRRYIPVEGSKDERFETARIAVDQVL